MSVRVEFGGGRINKKYTNTHTKMKQVENKTVNKPHEKIVQKPNRKPFSKNESKNVGEGSKVVPQGANKTVKKTNHKPANKTISKMVKVAVPKTTNKVNNKSSNKLKVIPLGGLGEIGKNITAFEYKEDIFVVDCGLAFPSDEMLGIDLVIPDVTYLKRNIERVRGIVITHGHEDHIGALPYVLKEVNVPVYGTKLTIGLIENKLREHNM